MLIKHTILHFLENEKMISLGGKNDNDNAMWPIYTPQGERLLKGGNKRDTNHKSKSHGNKKSTATNKAQKNSSSLKKQIERESGTTYK